MSELSESSITEPILLKLTSFLRRFGRFLITGGGYWPILVTCPFLLLMFKFIVNEWILAGDVYTGETSTGFFGRIVSLSGDGEVLATSVPTVSGDGCVKVFECLSARLTQAVFECLLCVGITSVLFSFCFMP